MFHILYNILKIKLVQAVNLVTCNLKVLISNLGMDTVHSN